MKRVNVLVAMDTTNQLHVLGVSREGQDLRDLLDLISEDGKLGDQVFLRAGIAKAIPFQIRRAFTAEPESESEV